MIEGGPVVLLCYLYICEQSLVYYFITHRYTTKLHEDDNDASIRIIETHSAPDIGPNIHAEPPIANKKSMSNLDISPNNVPSKWNISVSDESFLKMERLVTELCMSPKKEELDSKIDIDLTNHDSISSDNTSDSMTVSQKPSQFEADKINVLDVNSYKTPVKQSNCVPRTAHSAYLTSKTSRPDAYATPSTGSKTPFKTPGNPVHKKTTYTPSKKPFQHVMSPVAFYINSCTQVPLVKNVQPKKLLPGTSSIPKLVKSTPKTNLCNKENVSLPSIAYRSAKETKVVCIIYLLYTHQNVIQCWSNFVQGGATTAQTSNRNKSTHIHFQLNYITSKYFFFNK